MQPETVCSSRRELTEDTAVRWTQTAWGRRGQRICASATQRWAAFVAHYSLRDKWLIVALLIGLGLGLQGFTWGRYDCLNADRMAFSGIFPKGGPAFRPSGYLKPPFYTYLNYFLARAPADRITGAFLFWMKPHERDALNCRMRVSFARILNLAMFALCTMAIFVLATRYYGTGAARVAALLFASSAGFMPYQVFLTTDLAVVFVMLAAFLFAVRVTNHPGMSNSVMAGLLAGLAGATKYNGIAIAVVLPIAHLFAGRAGNPFVDALKRKSAWACGLCVPLGFVLGNPYAIFDWSRFKTDFLYNYATTPVYHGISTGNSYGHFLRCFLEIYGWPTALLLAVAIPVGLAAVMMRRKESRSWQPWLMAAAFFMVYFYQIGGFPRLETRFVLPVAPFAMIMASAGFAPMLRLRPAFQAVVAAIVLYNVVCGWWVGRLFVDDPRNYIHAFARERLQHGGVVEWSRSLPKLEGLPVDPTIHTIYTGLKQAEMFKNMFRGDPAMAATVAQKETQVTADWFAKSSRQARNPDYIMWCSIDLDGATLPEYNALFDASSGFRVIYDAKSPELPAWVYPQGTEFLQQRTTIWEKAPTN